MNKKIFKDMYKLPREAIYAFRNEKEKSVYITYSKDFLTAFSKNIREIRDKVHICKFLNRNIRDLEFEIIETMSKETTSLDIHCLLIHHIQRLRDEGYTVIGYRNIQPLRFRVHIGQDFKVYCKLITKQYKEYVVGVFETMKDANPFIETYKAMKVIFPVYASNTLTKEYIETLR
jgi:hypothetical protein